ncbi:hypothetical protein NFI96_005247 [Prochilodus magdalenae]|nr:hypothetical protein NFI96_005247 [Prochilodus magdalenae]
MGMKLKPKLDLHLIPPGLTQLSPPGFAKLKPEDGMPQFLIQLTWTCTLQRQARVLTLKSCLQSFYPWKKEFSLIYLIFQILNLTPTVPAEEQAPGEQSAIFFRCFIVWVSIFVLK